MPLPTIPKAKPRSILELIAAQKAAAIMDPPRIDDSSLPFGGASPETLAHEHFVRGLTIKPSDSNGRALVPHAMFEPVPAELVEAEPYVNHAEFTGTEEPGPFDHLIGKEFTMRLIHSREPEAPLPGAIPMAKVMARGLPRGLPRLIPANSGEVKPLIAASSAAAEVAIADSNKLLGLPAPETVEFEAVEENISDENEKLDRLIDDDFPFDESQLAAVHGMVTHQYATMIGEAGTGKTTVTKKLVDLLKEGVAQVDLSGYWKRGEQEDDDDYERPTHLIPSIAMISFTGRASQMVKKNFPKTWHPNIMTIHRCLGFYPEFFEDTNEAGDIVNKKRFIPAYTAMNQLPWKIIIIDEAGMLGLELWNQLLAACPNDTRIYMIGDIRQLPPTHGKSILGFALGSWPTYALTHVHRQKGVNNSIVDNAHRVMNGIMPICDSRELAPEFGRAGLSFMTPESTSKALKWLATNQEWRFLNITIDENPHKAQQRIRQVLKLLNDKTSLYEPNRDIVITPTNGFEPTSPGYVLGQQPLNQGLVSLLNTDAIRYWIDAGRERQNFAVGDKVMATVNDYEAGITNGMTGIVEQINENGGYSGNKSRYGRVDDVAAWLEACDSDQDEEDIDLDEMIAAGREALANKEKEQRESGPASHTVIIRFGEGDHSFTVDFGSKSQVASLMLAYAATCHKMQGGEAPLVFVIVHGTQKRPLNREWLYTAITRASGRCVLLSTRTGLGTALAKQSIKGKTLPEKIEAFRALTVPNMIGARLNVRLPEPRPYLGAE